MKKYHLVGEITISVNTCVEASSKERALKIASEREKVEIRATWQDDPESEWCTSGELDGEVQNIIVEEIEVVFSKKKKKVSP